MFVNGPLYLLAVLLVRVVGATPPACVIAAVNTQPDPSDLQAVCNGSNATEVRQYINTHCNNNVDAATSAFDAVCNNATSTNPSAASQGPASGTAATTSASPTSTDNSLASRVGMDIVGMVAIGVFGAMLAF